MSRGQVHALACVHTRVCKAVREPVPFGPLLPPFSALAAAAAPSTSAAAAPAASGGKASKAKTKEELEVEALMAEMDKPKDGASLQACVQRSNTAGPVNGWDGMGRELQTAGLLLLKCMQRLWVWPG